MALFQKVTKTRVSGMTGNISIRKFTNAYKEKSITISMLGEDMRKYSITLYAEEVEYLEYKIRNGEFNEKVEVDQKGRPDDGCVTNILA